MKLLALLVTFLGAASAYPAMNQLLAEVQKRQFASSTEMIGDLRNLPDIALSTVAKAIKAILLGTGVPTDLTTTYTAPAGGKDAAACRADRCCIWKYIANDMRAKMYDSSTGQCTNIARAAIRFGFHDAAAWSKTSGFGGADGSILLTDEMTRPENGGPAMAAIFAQHTAWWNTYKSYGITVADLIQTGAKVGAVSCPGGPRIRLFIGRVDNPHANPPNLLPPPSFDAPVIIELFQNKTIGPGGLVALIGAHTASRQNVVDATRVGDPQDSTPGTWDTTYFAQTLSSTAPAQVFKFHSDISLSQHPVTGPVYQQFANTGGKTVWDKVSLPFLPLSSSSPTWKRVIYLASDINSEACY
jgi:hypothetical protein